MMEEQNYRLHEECLVTGTAISHCVTNECYTTRHISPFVSSQTHHDHSVTPFNKSHHYPTNNELVSLRRLTSPVFENNPQPQTLSVQPQTLPIQPKNLPIDNNSICLMKTLDWLDCHDDKQYLQLVSNMLTTLRIHYKLYQEQAPFILDHCKVVSVCDSLIIIPPNLSSLDQSFNDVLKTANMNFLFSLIERKMSDITISYLMRMDIDEILDNTDRRNGLYYADTLRLLYKAVNSIINV